MRPKTKILLIVATALDIGPGEGSLSAKAITSAKAPGNYRYAARCYGFGFVAPGDSADAYKVFILDSRKPDYDKGDKDRNREPYFRGDTDDLRYLVRSLAVLPVPEIVVVIQRELLPKITPILAEQDIDSEVHQFMGTLQTS